MKVNYAEISRRLLVAANLKTTLEECEFSLNLFLSPNHGTEQNPPSHRIFDNTHAQNLEPAPFLVSGVSPKIGPKEVSSKIKKLRTEKGLRQIDLASRTGIARPNIARLESGRRMPNLATLVKIANALDVPVESFLIGDF